MEGAGSQAGMAERLKDFCFKDAHRDNLFRDGDSLARLPKKFRKLGPSHKGRKPQRDLKDEELRMRIYAKVKELSGRSLADLWATLSTSDLKPKETPKPSSEQLRIPTSAPDGQLYETRPDKKQSAPEFIATVYKEYLDGSFTRADLRRIDPGAIIGLKNWEARFGRSDLNLPTKKQLNDRFLETPRAVLSPHEVIAQNRIRSLRASNNRKK